MAVLSTLLLALAFGTSVAAIVVTVAPRWSLMVALLRHGAAAEWAPPPPPRRSARHAYAVRRPAAVVAGPVARAA